MSTPRNGVDITGTGPSYGSGAEDLPQQPATPKALDGFTATSAGVNLWTIGEQGATYDGYNETRITGLNMVPNTGTGIIQLNCFGQRVLVNANGVVTKKGEITLLWAVSFSGTVVNATAAIPAFP